MINTLTDEMIVQYLNTYATSGVFLSNFTVFFAEQLAYILGILLICLVFRDYLNKKGLYSVFALAVMIGVITRFIVKPVISFLYARPRPYVEHLDLSPLLSTLFDEKYQSFPSGHALFFFAVSTVLYKYNRMVGILFFVSSTLMGIARVATGLHYPTDIIAGAILGIICGAGGIYIFNKFFVVSHNKIIKRVKSV